MEEPASKRERKSAGKNAFFSCAFCHTTSPKPFKICDSCGQKQALADEEGHDVDDEG